MELTSSAFKQYENLPSKYTCDGAGISPPLTFSNVPKEAKSLVLIMEDPDVPKHIRADGMWDHWIIFNIPPETQTIPEGQPPEGIPGKGTADTLTYYGACPPDREHRYFFKLYAVDTLLDLAIGARKTDVLNAMAGHILATAELVGVYERHR